MVDGHVEDVGNGLSLVADFKRLAVIAFSVTRLAGHHDVGQEIHLNSLIAVAATCLAPAALDVKRKTTGFVTADLSLGEIDEKRTDVTEYTGVGGGIGTGSAPYRRLVNGDYLVNILYPLNTVIGQGTLKRAVEMLR